MKNSVNINTIKRAKHTLSAKKAIEAKQKEISYNPRVHKRLTHDKAISITRHGGRVGVYWEGTDGSEVLFETTPEKARNIVGIFNAKSNEQWSAHPSTVNCDRTHSPC